jgi:hypothetical protein
MAYHILPKGAYHGISRTIVFTDDAGFFVFFTLGAIGFGSYSLFGKPKALARKVLLSGSYNWC